MSRMRLPSSGLTIAACAVAIGALVASALPGVAVAESCPRERRREAEQLKRRAWKLVNEEPARAAEDLEKANELCPDPFYLGTLAVCYEQLGRYRDAMKALDAYLEHPDVPQREQAVSARERLRKRFGVVSLESAPAGAEVLVDGFPRIPTLLTPAKLDLEPGDHAFEAALEGFQKQAKTVAVAGGEELTLRFELEPVAAPQEPGPEPEPEPAEPPRARRLRWTGAVTIDAGWLFPLANDGLLSAVGLGGDLGGGFELGLLRVELVAFVSATPDADGYLLATGGGPRLGVAFGALPLAAELELLVGACLLSASQSGLVIPEGLHASLALVPTLALAWRPRRWLEVVAHVMRLELLGLAGDLPGGLAVRYGLDVGVRFRL